MGGLPWFFLLALGFHSIVNFVQLKLSHLFQFCYLLSTSFTFILLRFYSLIILSLNIIPTIDLTIFLFITINFFPDFSAMPPSPDFILRRISDVMILYLSLLLVTVTYISRTLLFMFRLSAFFVKNQF